MAEIEGVPFGTFAQVIEVLWRTDSRQAIKYITEKLVVKATRRAYRGRPERKRGNNTFLVTFGRPNYLEREFIKKAKAAKELFPIKRCQLRGFPARKAL